MRVKKYNQNPDILPRVCTERAPLVSFVVRRKRQQTKKKKQSMPTLTRVTGTNICRVFDNLPHLHVICLRVDTPRRASSCWRRARQIIHPSPSPFRTSGREAGARRANRQTLSRSAAGSRKARPPRRPLKRRLTRRHICSGRQAMWMMIWLLAGRWSWSLNLW